MNTLLLVCGMLCVYTLIGCLLIFNVTQHNPACSKFILTQLFVCALGIGSAVTIFRAPMESLKRVFAWLFCALYVSLLGLFVFGARINGSRSWYHFGEHTLQPAELLKPFFIVLLAYVCRETRRVSSPWIRLFLQLAFGLLFFVPIALQPDWGTLLVYLLVFFSMLWCDGLPKRMLLILIACALAGSSFAWFTFPHVQRRVKAYVRALPGMDGRQPYHTAHLIECIRRGGWLGRSVRGETGVYPLPYRYSDSLFAGAAEQFGVAGVVPIALLCFAWLYYCGSLAWHAKERTHALIYIGSGVAVTGQAVIHLAVNLGLIPTTGITLPMFSYGGSSLLATMVIFILVFRLNADGAEAPDLNAEQGSGADAVSQG